MDENITDGDSQPHPNIDGDLKIKLASIEAENKSMREEFNVQRAKLKELFLQKEADCKKLSKEVDELRKELNETKSQLVVIEYKRETDIQNHDRKAQEEIASLQQLVQETIDESSVLRNEINRLNLENERLKSERTELRAHGYSHSGPQTQLEAPSSPGLAPVLSHVKKTLARKLGGDSFHDNLEDSMRKAQEDAVVLRSLVVPLEEEIKALKEKLRTTDEDLQRCRTASGVSPNADSALVGMLNERKNNLSTIPGNESSNSNKQSLDELSKSPSSDVLTCAMCRNYESQLVTAQNDLEALRKEIERQNEDLAKEAELRRDLENKWQEKREVHKEEVQQLTNQVENNERELLVLQKHYTTFKDDINQELMKLTGERENVHRHLTTLQDDNDFLAGRYLATSEEMQNQMIDLPNTVEELQEALLRSHQSLIEARVGCEFEQRKSTSYLDESQVLRDQLQAAWAERQTMERDFSARIKALETHLKTIDADRNKLLALKDAFEKKEIDFNKQSSELRVQVIELRESNDKLEKHNFELRNKMSVLQQDLGNSEAVQKDFVKLSQSLQMELEKIRSANTSVRWQDDEDVDICPNCKTNFTVTRRKQNCRHCGTIYCEKCLTKTVPSGRNNKHVKVCDVCHTLLVQHTAPYFSQAPPQSPI